MIYSNIDYTRTQLKWFKVDFKELEELTAPWLITHTQVLHIDSKKAMYDEQIARVAVAFLRWVYLG